jgi:hypothetical protein
MIQPRFAECLISEREPVMSAFRILPALAAGAVLAGCAASTAGPPDFEAKNRPPEERCVRAAYNANKPVSRGPVTREQVLAEARAAARRGELDAVCNWL